MLIIGVLAVLVVVAYNGMQRNAGEAALRADMSAAFKQLAEYRLKHGGMYPADLTAANLKKADKVSYQYTYTDSDNSYYLTGSYDFPNVPTLCLQSKSGKLVSGPCPGHTDPNPAGGSTQPYGDLIAADNPSAYCRFDEPARSGSGWQQQSWACSIPGTYKDQSSTVPAWYTQETGALSSNPAVRLTTDGGAYDMRSSDVNSVRNNMNNWSVEVWVKFAGTSQNVAIVSAEQLWGLRSTSNGFACDHQRGSPWSVATVSGSATTPTTNTWFHVACTYDNGTLNLYVNGALVGTQTGATSYNSGGGQMSLGTYNSNWASSSSVQLNGWLDELALYKNKTLTTEQIQAHYQAAK